MATAGGPNIPKNNLTYTWDFSNPKCINDTSGAYGNELFTQTNLDPTNGATIHSGSSAINNYLEVDGNNDECPTGIDVSWNNTNSVSWAFWFNPTTVVASGGILGKQDALWEWSFFQSGQTLNLVYWNSGGGHSNGMDFEVDGIINDEWNFGAYTWDHTTSGAKFYLYNSTNSNTATHTATDPSINQNRSNQFCMGGKIYTWGDKYWGGAIGPVYLYERTLNDSEINRIYKGTKSRFGL